MSTLRTKFKWVKAEVESWGLNENDKGLFIPTGIGCALETIEKTPETAQKLNALCESIHKIKDDLDTWFLGDNQKQKEWLATPQDTLKGKSPIEFIKAGGIYSIAELAMTMEVP